MSSVRNLLAEYGITESQLQELFECVVTFLEKKGIVVTYTNLEPVIEEDVYKVIRDSNSSDGESHHETCISDGKEIWLHNDLEDVGGIAGRLYDILHVGCGHLWQWSANEKSTFVFNGDKAWEMGARTFLFAPDTELQEVRAYEKEASKISIQNLKNIFVGSKLSKSFQDSFIQFHNDYCVTDLHYIIDYYNTGEVKPFFDNWIKGAPLLPFINTGINLSISRRKNKCVSLIKK